jgi:hypothetical protein
MSPCGPDRRAARPAKRPPNAFLLFCRDERYSVWQCCPSMSPCDVLSLLSHVWRSLDDESKARYKQEEHRLQRECAIGIQTAGSNAKMATPIPRARVGSYRPGNYASLRCSTTASRNRQNSIIGVFLGEIKSFSARDGFLVTRRLHLIASFYWFFLFRYYRTDLILEIHLFNPLIILSLFVLQGMMLSTHPGISNFFTIWRSNKRKMDAHQGWELFFAHVDKKLSEIDADFVALNARRRGANRARRALLKGVCAPIPLTPLRPRPTDDLPQIREPITNYQFFPRRDNASARIFRPRRLEYAAFKHDHAKTPILIGSSCE